MKTSKILFSIVMISALMLGACVPVQSPTEPYPIDDSEEPTARTLILLIQIEVLFRIGWQE